MKIRIQQNSALHEKGGRFKNEDFVYPILDNAQLDSTITESIPNIPGLYMICDGVGGEQKGDVAAQLTASQFAKYFDTFPPSGQVTYGYLSAALIRVEEAFSNYLKANPDSRGMGTTLALLYLDDHGAMIAWIGDSRVYHFRNGESLYKTRDHSLVNDLIEQGEITEAAARYHPRRNVVLRVIKGTEEATDLDVHFIPVEEIEPGDFFFLCSDGVLEEVNDKELKTLFSGEFNAEDIRQEIYSLCKGNSNDNFSAYVVQLGDVNKEVVTDLPQETIAAASVIEDDDDILIVDDVEEPPQDVELEEETIIFQEEEEPAAEASVLDQLGKLQAKETEEEAPLNAEHHEDEAAAPPTQTVFDRLNKHAKEEKLHKNQEEFDFENKEEPVSTPPPPLSEPEVEQERDNNWILPAVLVSVVLLSLVAIIWLFQDSGNFNFFSNSNAWKTDYEQYITDAQEDLDAGKYQSAIQLADSAMKLAVEQQADGEIADAQKIRSLAEEQAAQRQEQRMINLQAMAQIEMEQKGQYPGFWRAREYFDEILNNYSALLDSLELSQINKKVVKCEEGMAQYSPAQSFQQLLSRGQSLCNDGEKVEAELFFTEAQGFANQIQKDDVLLAEVSKCMERPIAQNDDSPENQEPIAEANTESRGLQPADASSDANTRKAAPADNNTVADNNTADNNTTPPAETDPQTAQRTADPATAIGDPGTSKASSGSFLGETGVPVSATQTRGGASARIAGGSVDIASTLEAQQKALEDGKSLFRKSSKTKSAYEAKRAAEYLTQAGPAADGEAFYMLAVLHHQGLGLEKDVEKALEYAELSKKNEYTGGYFLYGVYLLERKNSVDSTNAINAIKIAAQRGHEGAKAKLQELGI